MKQSVAAVVLKQGRVLLIKRRDVPIWVLPGGGVDNGESPETAVVREVLEETGLIVTIKRPIAEYYPVNRLSNQTYLFECEHVSGSLSTGNETLALDFFPLDQLPRPFFFIHGDWLADAQSHSAGIIKKPLDKVTYFRLFLYFCCHPLKVIRYFLSRLGLPINS